MPQIAQLAETWSSQIFWMLIFFGFIFFVIGRGMVPKVMATVETRDRQIASDLAAAE
ncbi:MAG: ATPase, partial [Novosphingobium sp.]